MAARACACPAAIASAAVAWMGSARFAHGRRERLELKVAAAAAIPGDGAAWSGHRRVRRRLSRTESLAPVTQVNGTSELMGQVHEA